MPAALLGLVLTLCGNPDYSLAAGFEVVAWRWCRGGGVCRGRRRPGPRVAM